MAKLRGLEPNKVFVLLKVAFCLFVFFLFGLVPEEHFYEHISMCSVLIKAYETLDNNEMNCT